MAKTSVRAGDLGGFELGYELIRAGGAGGAGGGAAETGGAKTGDKKLALLLHGWGANRASMGIFAQIFAELGWEVCALDLPGFGASSEPAAAMDFRAYARVVAAFCAAKRLEPAAVVGHSFGCKVAAALLAERAHIYKENARANTAAGLTNGNETPLGGDFAAQPSGGERAVTAQISAQPPGGERVVTAQISAADGGVVTAGGCANASAKTPIIKSRTTAEQPLENRQIPRSHAAQNAALTPPHESENSSRPERFAPLLILAGAAGVPRPKPLAVRAKIALAKLFRGAKITRKMRAKDAANLSAVMYESFKIAVNDDARSSYKAAAEQAASTLILAGRADSATPLDTARELAALMENSALIEFAGGHFFYADAANRERLAAVIKQFINER